uniref:RRM domain-containing protein n=1 Tax=Globodera rostochiensis TaxID=31243 RepID=A0A914ICG1_GLORO
MCSTQSDSPPPQQRPTLMSCVCTPSADDGAGPLCKMSPPESAAAALSASIPDPSSAVPDPAPSSPVFVLLALTETEEECHSPRPSAVRSASSPSASSSSSSSSSDSAIASSSLLSSPTQNGVVARAASPSLCTSSSTGVSVLHVAHQSVDGGTWEPVGPVQHLRMDLHNAMDQLQKMANLVAHRAVLFCSREAIRQSIYPLCANAMLAQLAAEEAERCGELRQDVQLFSARLPLPSLFHAFVPFSLPYDVPPSIVPSSESAVEVNGGGGGGGGQETPTEPMECGGAELRRQLEERIRRMGAKLRERGESAVAILSRLDRVAQGYTPAVCSEMHVDSRCVVRARGLPWHVSDLDVALFFAGLDIPPGGIALCLGPEGRRSGEALVRFSRADQRELALQRHRRHLHARYIEVYRASGDEFVKHAVGTDSQAVRFALRAETAMAMIVRMRGLPFTATEQQVRDFFSSDGQPSGLLDQPGAVLFVHRPDGRPSGDAFVLFGDEQSGRRALAKHRQRMGGRYIELFRTTQAEVQQLFNARAIAQQNAAIAAAMNKLGAVVPLTTVQQNVLTPASPTTAPAALSGTAGAAPPAQQRVPQQRQRDCLRLRGLPYEAQVQQVVEFLGPHARQVLFQGVHMIYNSAGHPSGEAFIQMESEQAAAQAALEMHNKYMELGKKRRYIEVFQCCSEDMSLLLNVLPPPSPVNGLLPPPPLTPTGGPPALFPMSTPLNPLGAGGGAASPSPLLAAFPVPPQFLAFPSPAAVSNGDPSMGGGVLVAVSGQFAGPLVQQLYAAPPPPDTTGAQFAHHSAVPAEFWLRNMAALRNGAAAIATTAAAPFAAPTPLLPFHQHQLHTLPPFAAPTSISFAAAPTEVVAVQQPT